MKNFLLLVPLALLTQPVWAQHTEVSVRAGLILANFLGSGATAAGTAKGDFFDAATPPAFHIDPYIRNPYSRRLGAGVSASLRVQRVGLGGGLLALEAGIDQAQSHSRITLFDGTPLLWMGPYQLTEPATGSARLRRWMVPFFAGLGRRFHGSGPLQLDVLVGPELALLFATSEKGSGTHSGTYQPVETPWQIDVSRSIRRRAVLHLRADFTAWYQRLGLNGSYAWGITDLQTELADYPDASIAGSVHSQTLRVGIAYRLR
jgi:hypothetical protein